MFSSMKTTSKIVLIYFLTITLVDAGILDYIKSFNFLQTESESHEIAEGFDSKIPYEVSVPDEKFIAQAIKLTGIVKSELDTCQHRVVLKLRTDCQSMNDEMISKLAVALLNCQSYVEGRRIYPCTEQMSIKECTTSMDADAWNSYHLMSNRARAVCYSIRQNQFRGLTEHTVNRLMDAARDQINTLGKIAQDQENIHNIAQDTLHSVSQGQAELVEQQKDLQKAQLYGQLAIENNIKRLSDEKEMIIQSQKQLAQMTKSMKEKLEEASKQLEDQASETDNNHKALIDDLYKIQEKANFIFQKIEDSSKLLIKQSEMAQDQYKSTLNQLSEVNATVHSLVSMVGGTKKALEDQLSWISTHLGGTDDALEKVYTILWHIAFLLIGMLACAFLGARVSTRIAVVSIVPLNLALSYYKFEQAQDAFTLGITLAVYILVQTLILSIIRLTKRTPAPLAVKANSSEATPTKLSPIRENNFDESRSEYNTYNYSNSPLSTLRERIVNTEDIYLNDSINEDNYVSPTPPMSRTGYYLNRSRSRTPMSLNFSSKMHCLANTRQGTPCKLNAVAGRDYCHRHQKGDSVMG